MPRPFRFGLQITGDHQADPVAAAVRAEALGFDVVTVSDHVGPGPSPLPTLAAIAQGTSRIRLGTFVLNNDMRNPVQLAWDAATTDRLSGGRFELGLGAGHTPQEYAATGIELDGAQRPKRRLAESVEVIRRLVDGETMDHAGDHYRVEGARIDPERAGPTGSRSPTTGPPPWPPSATRSRGSRPTRPGRFPTCSSEPSTRS